MVIIVVYGEMFEIVIFQEVFEEEISLVSRSGDWGGVSITSDIQDRARVLLTKDIHGILKLRKIFHESSIVASCTKIDINVDADLIAWLIKDKSKNTAG